MNPLNGNTIDYEFGNFIKIADLIYYDGPLLSHYISPKGENYLFYWVDADDVYNRWMVLRVDLQTLQNYLEKKLSLRQVVTLPNDGFVYFVDINDSVEYHNIHVVAPRDIPEDYQPEDNSYYTFEIHEDIDLSALSQKYGSGILELHISGRSVKYGSMHFRMYAHLLTQIDEIRSRMASLYIRRVKKQSPDADQSALVQALRLDTEYEFLFPLAGSVRVLLKPVNPQRSFTVTTADDFAKDFVGLISSGYSSEDIVRYSNLYDQVVIKRYADLVQCLNKEHLSLGVKWRNEEANVFVSEGIKLKDTEKVLSNLLNFKYDDTETFDWEGQFYSVNIKSGSYAFVTADGEEFKSIGHFAPVLHDALWNISFGKTYKVKINRSSSELVGQQRKYHDVMVSFEERIEKI
jgi:hypothetical protein